jgi:hypothetical protein
MARKHKIKKGDLDVSDDYKLSMEIEDAVDVPPGEEPNPSEVKDEIRIVQTNPCTWINVGGRWKRVCW